MEQMINRITDVELLPSSPTCHKPMLAASASFSDQVSIEELCGIVSPDQVSDEDGTYKYIYKIEIHSKKDLGINMAGVGKIIIFK